MLMYPSRSRHEMQCFYAAAIHGAQSKTTLFLPSGLVYNYEYSNGDSHVTNSIEPDDDSSGHFMYRLAVLIEPSLQVRDL